MSKSTDESLVFVLKSLLNDLGCSKPKESQIFDVLVLPFSLFKFK